jgi:hypothetical protein
MNRVLDLHLQAQINKLFILNDAPCSLIVDRHISICGGAAASASARRDEAFQLPRESVVRWRSSRLAGANIASGSDIVIRRSGV